jgi:hypothetical protein
VTRKSNPFNTYELFGPRIRQRPAGVAIAASSDGDELVELERGVCNGYEATVRCTKGALGDYFTDARRAGSGSGQSEMLRVRHGPERVASGARSEIIRAFQGNCDLTRNRF